MRVQYTLPDDLCAQLRSRADALDIPLSRLVEHYLRQALTTGEAVTLRPKSRMNAPVVPATAPRGREEVPVCEECATELREENTDAQGEHLNCPLRK